MIRCIESHYDADRGDFYDVTTLIPENVGFWELENVRRHLSKLTAKYGPVTALTGTPGQPYTAVNLEGRGLIYAVYVRFERVEDIPIEGIISDDVTRYYYDTGR